MGGEELPQRLQEEAQNRLEQAADDGCAHDGAIGDHTAAHGGGDAVEHADEAGGRAHDDGDPAAHGADGEQLHQGDDARHQHGILQQAQLQLGEFPAGDAAGAGDDQQRRQIAHKHSQNVLQTQRDRLAQRHFSVKLESRLMELKVIFHTQTLSFLVF